MLLANSELKDGLPIWLRLALFCIRGIRGDVSTGSARQRLFHRLSHQLAADAADFRLS